MGWREYKNSTPIDNIDNIDNIQGDSHIVDKVDIVYRGENNILNEIKGHIPGQAEESPDPFQVSGESIKVFFPILKGDVWLCSDAQARERVKYEGLPCFTFEDLQYIHQGRPGAERRARLQEVYAKRHPTTENILDLFHGKITSIKVKEEQPC